MAGKLTAIKQSFVALIGFRGGGMCCENNRLALFIPERSHSQSSTLGCQPIEVPTTWLPRGQHPYGTAASAIPDNALKVHNLSPPWNPIRASFVYVRSAQLKDKCISFNSDLLAWLRLGGGRFRRCFPNGLHNLSGRLRDFL